MYKLIAAFCRNFYYRYLCVQFLEDVGVKIFAGRSSEALAAKVAENFGVALGDVKVSVFSDGEFQPSFEETVRGQDVFIVQSTMPPTENLFELHGGTKVIIYLLKDDTKMIYTINGPINPRAGKLTAAAKKF